jgi:hypothetical protein
MGCVRTCSTCKCTVQPDTKGSLGSVLLSSSSRTRFLPLPVGAVPKEMHRTRLALHDRAHRKTTEKLLQSAQSTHCHNVRVINEGQNKAGPWGFLRRHPVASDSRHGLTGCTTFLATERQAGAKAGRPDLLKSSLKTLVHTRRAMAT